MSKADEVLEEIQKQNYYLDAIAQAVNSNQVRVTQIIGRLIIQGKLDGELNKEQTMYVPGFTSEEYKKTVRMGIIARVIAPLGLILTMILPIVFVITVSIGGGFLIDQWKINMFYIMATVTILVCISGLVVSLPIRQIKSGRSTFVLSIFSLISAIMFSAMIILFLTIFKNVFSGFPF